MHIKVFFGFSMVMPQGRTVNTLRAIKYLIYLGWVCKSDSGGGKGGSWLPPPKILGTNATPQTSKKEIKKGEKKVGKRAKDERKKEKEGENKNIIPFHNLKISLIWRGRGRNYPICHHQSDFWIRPCKCAIGQCFVGVLSLVRWPTGSGKNNSIGQFNVITVEHRIWAKIFFEECFWKLELHLVFTCKLCNSIWAFLYCKKYGPISGTQLIDGEKQLFWNSLWQPTTHF